MSGELSVNATRHHPNSINKAILSFVKRLRAYVKLGVDTLNMSWDKLFSQSFELVVGDVSFDFNTGIMMKIVIFIVIVLHGSVVV